VHSLQAALEREAWDGDWYRRAYFDDGTPLGSATNAECRIDSIAQSWAVLSGAANPARAARAMAAVEEYLVRRDQELILLFTPPFDRAPLDPGYIAGYPPGVRENGGQYSHAAMWSVMAFAALGDGDKAGELFSILNPINRASTRAGVDRKSTRLNSSHDQSSYAVFPSPPLPSFPTRRSSDLFDRAPLDPGYIAGYPPGVRENGGQYSHAAMWSVMAFAALGDGDKAGELFSILNPINRASTRAG